LAAKAESQVVPISKTNRPTTIRKPSSSSRHWRPC